MCDFSRSIFTDCFIRSTKNYIHSRFFFYFCFKPDCYKVACPFGQEKIPSFSRVLACKQHLYAIYIASAFEDLRKPDMQGGGVHPRIACHIFFLSTTNICAICLKISTSLPHSARYKCTHDYKRRSFDHWLPRERSA